MNSEPGFSEDALLIALAGLSAGIVVGILAKQRGTALVVTAAAGFVVGPIIFAAVGSRGSVTAQLVTWLGVSASILLSTRLSGYAMVGSLAAVVLVGVGAGALVRSLPEAPLAVVVIVEGYTVDGSTGECSGVGEASEIAAGKSISFVDDRTGGDVGSALLEPGMETDSACRFDLGDPLGLPAHESDFILLDPAYHGAFGYSTSFDGNRVVIRLQND